MEMFLDCVSTKKLNSKPGADTGQTPEPLWYLHFATAGEPEKSF